MTGKSSSPKVSVVIPTLHLTRPKNPKYFMFQRYTLQQVLSDLASNVELPIEVVIVCNGQDPELVEVVRTHERVDKFCLNSVNVGVARSWNMGAMMAEGEALCFLNDDVEVGPGAIEALYQTLISDETIGVTGPQGNTLEGGGHGRFVGVTEPEDADMISGFCLMMRAATFHRFGGFDIAYTPASYEESDFCFTVRKHGLRCRVVPGLALKHYLRHGVSARKGEIEYLNKRIHSSDLHQRNRAYFVRKWNPGT